MEFIGVNLVQTTTGIIVTSNTETAENLLKRDETFQYVTSGFNDDNTTSAITFTFSSAQVISRIGMLGHNLREYRMYYNGSTANTFSFTTTSHTTTSHFSSNSDTAQYFKFNAVTVSSITIDMIKTMEANQEKAIGYFHASENELSFSQIPSAPDYDPNYTPMESVHKMADGGTKINRLSKKFSTTIKFKYINSSFRDDLYSFWNTASPFVFVPFGTSTAWTGIMHEVVWPGKFEFYQYADNAVNAGFLGKITLMET